MAYDVARRGIVVFGGQRDRQTAFGDTWLWNGRDWALVAESGPSARSYAAMAYDARRSRVVLADPGIAYDPAGGRVVLYGGRAPQDEPLADLWTWDGVRWQRPN